MHSACILFLFLWLTFCAKNHVHSRFQDRLATRKQHRRASLLRLLATRDVSAREDQDTEDFQSAKAWRVMVGVGICIGSSLPPWHSLPVFIDEKIAADPFLPGLTEATLPITTTAIFVGWVVGSLGLPRAMQVFSTEQLLLVCVVGLVLISFALVTVPYITAGSLAAFTCLRFVQGIFMNITMLQCIYVQDSLPSEWGNRALVCTNVMYCLFDIFMSAICGGPALNADWRIESLLFYAVPMPLGILIAFPNFMEILKSIPQAGKALFQSSSRFQPVSTSAVESSLSPSEIHHAIALASAFLACGCSFHGLSYSAGQLSSNRYMSMALLNGADIVGYLGALSAGSWGRGKVQSTAFFLASLSSLDWAIDILWVCDFNFQLNNDHVVRCDMSFLWFHYIPLYGSDTAMSPNSFQSAFACLTFSECTESHVWEKRPSSLQHWRPRNSFGVGFSNGGPTVPWCLLHVDLPDGGGCFHPLSSKNCVANLWLDCRNGNLKGDEFVMNHDESWSFGAAFGFAKSFMAHGRIHHNMHIWTITPFVQIAFCCYRLRSDWVSPGWVSWAFRFFLAVAQAKSWCG